MAHPAGLLGINPSSSLHSDRLTEVRRQLRWRCVNELMCKFSSAEFAIKKTSNKCWFFMAHPAGFELTTF